MVDLEVQAAQDALRGCRLVVLHEIDVDTPCDKVGLLVGFHEVAPLVSVRLHVDDDDTVNRSRGKGEVPKVFLHFYSSLRRLSSLLNW